MPQPPVPCQADFKGLALRKLRKAQRLRCKHSSVWQVTKAGSWLLCCVWYALDKKRTTVIHTFLGAYFQQQTTPILRFSATVLADLTDHATHLVSLDRSFLLHKVIRRVYSVRSWIQL